MYPFLVLHEYNIYSSAVTFLNVVTIVHFSEETFHILNLKTAFAMVF